MKKLLVILLLAFCSIGASKPDPYNSLSPGQKALFQPVVERYIRDNEKQDWADLWEIQDQTSNMKNELLSGQRDAPDRSRAQFIEAMRYNIASGGLPRLRTFELREVRPDKDDFIMIGCGEVTRESFKATGFVIAGIRLVDGKPRFDLWSLTSHFC